tara:strand:- start:2 stop:229 length:228 start_codon:yes stop_codon:yes gene_type:complete
MRLRLKLQKWLLSITDVKLERFIDWFVKLFLGIIGLAAMGYFLTKGTPVDYLCVLLVVVIRSLWRIEQLLEKNDK